MKHLEEVAALLREGMTARQISDRLGIHTSTVWAAIARYREPSDTMRSIVRRVPVVGCQGSATCYYQPVSVARLSFLEGVAA